MVSRFYQKHAYLLLGIVVLTFPFFTYHADTIPTNNNIETWLPEQSEVRVTYGEFKRQFGAEEVVLVGIATPEPDERLMEALAQRIEQVSGVRRCWSPGRLRNLMRELDVPEAEIDTRLKNFIVSGNSSLIGLIALFSDEGVKDRIGTVRAIREQVEYCQLHGDDVAFAGAPVVVAELDRLGNRGRNKSYFLITLFVSLCLLYYTIRQWNLAISILLLTVWAINLTTALIKFAGGEMNFILGALSVMVMVFTLAIAIHFLHYYRACTHDDDPLGGALRLAWKPCVLATLTTVIGLMSLGISDIAPVRHFGYAAAAGSVVALMTGLGLTPALLLLWPLSESKSRWEQAWLTRAVNWLLDRKTSVAVTAGLLVALTSLGLTRLTSKIDPLDFLPKSGKVLADVRRIERDLTNTSTIEAVVDFGGRDLPFVDKLDEVRRLERVIAGHAAVRHTTSVATFFPNEMPENPLETARLLARAQSRQGENDYLADGERLWRISARISTASGYTRQQTFHDLIAMTGDAPVTFTGIAPLLEGAQREIFNGFWESFAVAFGMITLVMIVSLRSLKLGLIAMIPNLTPIGIVFGMLGWINFPIDIGMTMTGSIALGIAVDGTFHYLVRYNEQFRRSQDSPQAARIALLQTGPPIFTAALIAAIGMLAMTLSSFTPMARFGYMMATLLMAALVGDLVLLPVILSHRRGAARSAGPHAESEIAACHFHKPAERPLIGAVQQTGARR